MSEHETAPATGAHETATQAGAYGTPALPAGHDGGVTPVLRDPGLPAHRPRRTDIDPKAARAVERQIAGMFILSMICTVGFFVAFFTFKVGTPEGTKNSTFFLGLTLGLALLLIGIGAIHWAKKLMPDVEIVQERHELRSDDTTRDEAIRLIKAGGASSGFTRRKLIRNTMFGAIGTLALSPILLLRDLGPLPGKKLTYTAWGVNTRAVIEHTGAPIRPTDIPLGGIVHVLPEGNLDEAELAKSPVVLIRLQPDQFHMDAQHMSWTYNGIVAYSGICTHVGCPVSLYEQQTHHLLCPCHQSTFDVPRAAKVIFGPAARALPQLPLTVDTDGYLVSKHDFDEPVGPSFWEL
ncbi:MAG: cytochrome bc1 complex Rieske iron-sulfur subunit [Actinomycetes bacterium]